MAQEAEISKTTNPHTYLLALKHICCLGLNLCIFFFISPEPILAAPDSCRPGQEGSVHGCQLSDHSYVVEHQREPGDTAVVLVDRVMLVQELWLRLVQSRNGNTQPPQAMGSSDLLKFCSFAPTTKEKSKRRLANKYCKISAYY